MSEFFSFLKVFAICGTLFFITMIVLIAMPQARLRSVGREMFKWALVAGLLLLVVSPIDILPDPMYLDDLGYLVAAICSAQDAFKERKRRRVLDDMEFEEAAAKERGESDACDDDEDDKREAA